MLIIIRYIIAAIRYQVQGCRELPPTFPAANSAWPNSNDALFGTRRFTFFQCCTAQELEKMNDWFIKAALDVMASVSGLSQQPEALLAEPN